MAFDIKRATKVENSTGAVMWQWTLYQQLSDEKY